MKLIKNDCVWGFLIELNSIINKDAMYVDLMMDERFDDPNDHTVRFQAKLNSLFIGGANWSSSAKFKEVVKTLAGKYFMTDQIHFNNTGCIFWVFREDISPERSGGENDRNELR